MGEILGLGCTHYPGLLLPDERMPGGFHHLLTAPNVPASAKDRANWPDALLAELGNDAGVSSARRYGARMADGFRAVRASLEAFDPDIVLIFGDDQYENFREDGVAPFCVFALDNIESRPYARMGKATNAWGEPNDTVIHTLGHKAAGRYLAGALIEQGFDVSYAYTMRHEAGLPHAFINALLLLDYDRRGLPWPVVPFHVNCYGSSTISKRGAFAHIDGTGSDEPDPPGPTAARCFALGAAAGRALAASPWRVALVASSSWSHSFLTARNHYVWPDMEADRARYQELRDGQFSRWRDLTTAQLEDAGQQELLNWVCLAGAMDALGQRAVWTDLAETYVLNANKVFAIFGAG